MRKGAVWGAFALASLLGLAAVSWALRGAPAPQDRSVALPPPTEDGLQIVVLGTSLSHREIWPTALAEALTACWGHPVPMTVIARPGAAVDWGLTQVAQVAGAQPDIVLVEFAINDADLRDGHSLGAARRLHGQLLTELQTALPEAAIVLMTMSPAHGLRGLMRPRLGAHYLQYRTLAETYDVGLIDLFPHWLALPRAARGLQADGLHPDPQVAADLIAPKAAAVLTGSVCP